MINQTDVIPRHNTAIFRWVSLATLLTIIFLAAYLRLHNVTNTPGWYTDEGTHLEIARHLREGRIQYMAVTQSTLLFARMPLFELLLAFSTSLFGSSMATLRTLTGLLGLLTVALVYPVIYRLSEKNRLFALFCTFAVAVYPSAVLYSRFGFSYNLLPPFILGSYYFLSQYQRTVRRSSLFIAGILIGLGIISDLAAGTFLVVLLLLVVWKRISDLLWVIPIAMLPFAIYVGIMLLLYPDAFLFDLDYTLFRLNTLSSLEQIENIARNYNVLLKEDYWMVAGIIGILLMPNKNMRWITLFYLLIPIILLGRAVALFHLSYYYNIPILSFVAIGVGHLLYRGWKAIGEFVEDFVKDTENGRGAVILVGAVGILLVGLPIIDVIGTQVRYVQDGYPTEIDAFLTSSHEANTIADFINTNTVLSDYVVANPTIAWAFDTKVADLQMIVVGNGVSTPHLPADLTPERFAFDTDYRNARYVVTDPLWYIWGLVHIPELVVILRDVESWPIALQTETLTIYANPALTQSGR